MKRKNKRITLRLYKDFFYKILNKEKKIEYRDKSEYWLKRLTPDIKEILFINGYGKTRPHLLMSVNQILINTQDIEIHLGKIIHKWNIGESNGKTESSFK